MIENCIRNRAMLSVELKKLIGKSFHLTIKHKSVDNYVVLRVLSDETPIGLHMENSQSEAFVQFDCYSKDPWACKRIAKEIDKIFNTKGFADSETRIDVQLALKKDRRPDYETDSGLHRESLEYEFHYNEV